MFPARVCVLSCCHKGLQTVGVKTTHAHSLATPESRSPNSMALHYMVSHKHTGLVLTGARRVCSSILKPRLHPVPLKTALFPISPTTPCCLWRAHLLRSEIPSSFPVSRGPERDILVWGVILSTTPWLVETGKAGFGVENMWYLGVGFATGGLRTSK